MEVTSCKLLDLGCGRRKLEGALGVDCCADSAADLIWDLNRVPWPLPDNQFTLVRAIDVLEHVENVIACMEEIARVATAQATVIIQVPFASSPHVWTDPTHRRGFTSKSFQYFTAEFCARHFHYTRARFAVRHVEYKSTGQRWFDRILHRFANRHKALYEKRFLYWYPVQTVCFALTVQKDGAS